MKSITIRGVREDLRIPRIAFGTGSALKGLEKRQYFNLFDLYVRNGGRVLDTAPGYCGGNSERYIGQWLQAHGCRKQVILSTKACHAFPGEPSRLTKADMLHDLALSLEQLQTDYIDIFWIHNDDPAVPVEAIMEAVNDVAKTGTVRSLGCSNWTTGRIAAANAYAAEHGLQGFAANQIQWSLARAGGDYAKRYNALTMDDESYAWHLSSGLAVFAFSAMAQGYFSIAATGGTAALPDDTRRYFDSPENRARLERVKDYMAAHSVSAAVPVLGYLTNNRLPAVALVSTTRPENLLDLLSAANESMTADEADALLGL